VVLGEDGEDAAGIAQDGYDFQELLARRHGRQRRRVGFTEDALVREYTILQEEVESVLRHAGLAASPGAAAEPLVIMRRLLSRARQISLDAFARSGEARV
jgi:hypothetical protein